MAQSNLEHAASTWHHHVLTNALVLAAGIKKAQNRLLTHHAEPNRTHRPGVDAGKRCSARVHGERCRAAFKMGVVNKG